MGVLLWILRAIIILIIIRFVLRLLFPQQPKVRKRRNVPGPVERIGGELVRDPHCGTYVPKARALAVGSGSDTKYFCSATCRDAYGN